LRVYADGTPNQNGSLRRLHRDFPTAQPVNASLVRASRVEDPESYDAIDGLRQLAEQRRPFAPLSNARTPLLRERASLYVTQDDGTNEPSSGRSRKFRAKSARLPYAASASAKTGWSSPTGTGCTFSGGEPIKISQEIQPTWNQINWQYAPHALGHRGHEGNAVSLSAFRLGAATSPNKILMLDYRDLDDAEDIAGRPPIKLPTLAAKTRRGQNAQVGRRGRLRPTPARSSSAATAGLRCPRWRNAWRGRWRRYGPRPIN